MKSNHETALIKKFNAGDPDAFNEIFERYRIRLRYFVTNLVGDEAEADDIVLITFEKLFKRSANFPTQTKIRSFLYTTAKNAGFDYLRLNKRQKKSQEELTNRTDSSEEGTINRIIKAELLEEIRNEIKKLPEKQRLIIMLSYYEGMSHKEIAERLNTSEVVVRVTKFRVLRELRKFLSTKRLLSGFMTIYLFFV